MAVLYSRVALDLGDTPSEAGAVTYFSDSKIAIQIGSVTAEYVGFGFSIPDNGPVGGTLTGYSTYENGKLGFALYGASITLAEVLQHAESGKIAALNASILKGDDLIIGSEWSDTLYGYGGDNHIFGGDGADYIYGGAGNDIIDGGAGPNWIDGGEGRDTAVFVSDRASYDLAWEGSLFFARRHDDYSFDALISIERLQFADGVLALDISGNAGQAYRIYQAAFDRTPDTDGLGYWTGRLDTGTSLTQVASEFVGSQEFRDIYGEHSSNADFVARLYRNILDREGDDGGKQYWEGELSSGHRSRADVLVGFSESQENIVGVAPAIADGIWLG